MSERMFRFLRADEIDCRIGSIKEKGLSLLLYKDARCDMNILDETVGAFNWQRHHSRDNANCTVSIYDEQKNEWIEKEDTGTESNTEAEKGLASDSFKRACVNWGIGRELYTAPFIWIPSSLCNITENKGRLSCYDRFRVVEIGHNERGEINKLLITNDTIGTDVYSFPRNAENAPILNEKPREGRDTTEAPKTQEKPKETPTAKNGSYYDQIAEVLQHDDFGYFVPCADCKTYIRDQKKKDGSVYSVQDYVAACLKTYGRPICNKCRKKNGTTA